MSQFKITLLNIQAGVGVTRGYWQYITRSWRYFFTHTLRTQPLKDYIKTNTIDIAVLTETSTTLGFSDGSKLASDLTGLPNHTFTDYTLWKVFRLGNSISTRHNIVSVKEHTLSSVREQRPLLEIELNVHGESLVIFVIHLSLLKAERKHQILHISNLVRNLGRPLLLAGDFNTNNDEELEPLSNIGLTKVSLPTYPSWKPKKRFCHIFINHKISVVALSVPDIRLSDHLPLTAVLQFNNK